MIERPALADPEIAAATFGKHLEELWATGRPGKLGWRRIARDSLHQVVILPAKRASGAVDDYHVLLGAEYYDRWPPTAVFVVPDEWTEAQADSRWFPAFTNVPGWFGLHASYEFLAEYTVKGSMHHQLVCFSGTAGYYITGHVPTETERWRQGERTVAMTLNRLHYVLQQPHYDKPSAE